MYKEKIQNILAELSVGLFEREECLKLVLLSMFAGKSIFLYGPPGTAKSMIARRASLAFKSPEFSKISENSKNSENSKAEFFGKSENSSLENSISENSENSILKNSGLFAYLMNRFSTPEEIFGPIDISELKKNNLTRKTQGYLPTAHFAFLDEIWKSSPAILNTLLTIINERIYRDGNTDIKVPLKGIVCASNEFPPANQGLEALYDRMILRYFVKPLEERENFLKLVSSNDDESVKISETFSLKELDEILKLSKKVSFDESASKAFCQIKAMIDELRIKPQLIKELFGLEGVSVPYISDRRYKECANILKVSAVLNDRDFIVKDDLALLAHSLWEDEKQMELIKKVLEKILGSDEEIKGLKASLKALETKAKNSTFDSLKDEFATLRERVTEKQMSLDNEINSTPSNVFLGYSQKTAIKELKNLSLGLDECQTNTLLKDEKNHKMLEAVYKKAEKILQASGVDDSKSISEVKLAINQHFMGQMNDDELAKKFASVIVFGKMANNASLGLAKLFSEVIAQNSSNDLLAAGAKGISAAISHDKDRLIDELMKTVNEHKKA